MQKEDVENGLTESYFYEKEDFEDVQNWSQECQGKLLTSLSFSFFIYVTRTIVVPTWWSCEG